MSKTAKAVAARSVVVHEDPAMIDELDYFGPDDGFERIIVDFTDAVKRSKPGLMRDLARQGWVIELESKLAAGMYRMKMPKAKWQAIQDANLTAYQELLQGMPTPSDPRAGMVGRMEHSAELLSTEELLHYAQQGKAPAARDA
jgi:hypothetical protein